MRLRPLVTVILFILTLEGMARIDTGLQIANRGSVVPPTINSTFVNDQIGPRIPPYTTWRWVTTNRYGFNDSDDYTYTQRTHRWRILVIGDSIPMGMIAPGTGNWPAMLAHDLQQQGWDVEVINASRAGASLPEITDRLAGDYYQFHPDIIIEQSSFHTLYGQKAGQLSLPYIWPLRELKDASAFAQKVTTYRPPNIQTAIILQRLRFGITHLDQTLPPTYATELTSQLDRLTTTAQTLNAPLLVVTVPHATDSSYAINYLYTSPWLATTDTLEQGFGELNSLVVAHAGPYTAVDIRPVLESDQSAFFDFVHYTAKGNILTAQALSAQLTPILQQLASRHVPS